MKVLDPRVLEAGVCLRLYSQCTEERRQALELNIFTDPTNARLLASVRRDCVPCQKTATVSCCNSGRWN